MSIDAVDNSSNVVPQPEKVTPEGMKRSVLKSSLTPITGRINRIIGFTEVRALGYVLDKRWKAERPLTTDNFMTDVLGLGEGDSGHQAEMKISQSVSGALKDDYEARLAAAAVADPVEHGKLKALWTMIEKSDELTKRVFEHGNSKIHLGGVPEYWLPDWVKTFDK